MIEVHSVPIACGGVLRIFTDVTDRRRNEARAGHLARRDGLTELVNREVLFEYVADAAVSSARTSKGFAIHFIDLDRFKRVNDQFGHSVGDKVLATIADKMRHFAREADI